MKDKERWEELCELAATEQNSEKLIQLTNEIGRLLEEKNARLRNKPPDPTNQGS